MNHEIGSAIYHCLSIRCTNTAVEFSVMTAILITNSCFKYVSKFKSVNVSLFFL
jgi:hypothetical protein